MKIINESIQWVVILTMLFILLFQIDFDLFQSLPKRTTQTEERLSEQKTMLTSLQKQVAEIRTQVTQIDKKIQIFEKRISTARDSKDLEQMKKNVASLETELNFLYDVIQQQAISSKATQITLEPKVENGLKLKSTSEWVRTNWSSLAVPLALVLFCLLIYLTVRRRRSVSSDITHLYMVKSPPNVDRECA